MSATMPTVDSDPDIRRERKALPSLTGVRFFAALLVFFIHALQPIGPVDHSGPVNPFGDKDVADGLYTFFGPAGFLGVSFFFLLSGFVITWSVKPGERLTAYWRRRLVKIFPNHLVMWTLALGLFAYAYTSVTTGFLSLFLVNSWVNALDVQMSVNAPSWSLCAEMLFYLSFPLLLHFVRRIPARRLYWYAAGTIVGMIGVGLVTTYVITDSPSNPMIPLSPSQMWFNYTLPPTRMFEFVLGMLLARIVLAGRWPKIGAVPVIALVAAGYVAAIYVPAPYNFVATTAIPFSVAIASLAAADVRGANTRLRGPVMQWLGNVSFGFYLAQGVVIFWGRQALLGNGTFSTPVAILVMLGMFAATLLAGWLLYTFVEMPAMRRWSRPRPRPAPAPRAEESPALVSVPREAARTAAWTPGAEPAVRP
ncbi:acyltransferase [Streptomyces chryseus]|uniref:Acyltransferase n=1 Tax=Streptomyces chryseus TaxID=68186 RepID=A0ABQ3DUN2_9ACTN|nr:acyltransferase [Streptomyces chryseus]